VSFTQLGTAYPQVFIANPLTDVVRGVVQKDIPNGKTGYITGLGFLNEVDTSTWSPGTQLYGDMFGDLTPAVLGFPVGVVLKQDATCGIIYLDTYGFSFNQFSVSGAWKITGNAALTSSNKLGTLDGIPVNFYSNGIQRGILDAAGNWGFGELVPDFPIVEKFHAGFAGSGVRHTTFALAASDTLYHPIFSLAVTADWVLTAEFTVVAKEGSTNRASFKRTATFYKSGLSLIQADPIPQTDYTYKSSGNFDVRISVASDTLSFEIKNANATATNWVGDVKINVSV
jgi:hypothetical protein